MKRKNLVISIVIIIFLLILSLSCDDLFNLTPNISKDLFGEWYRIGIDGGNTDYQVPSFYITSNKIIYMGAYSTDKKDITGEVKEIKKVSNNVIKLTTRSDTYLLFPKRIPNASFSGNITSLSSSSLLNIDKNDRTIIPSNRSAGGSIQVVVDNVNDAAQKTKATTDDNGRFKVDSVIPGDRYIITAEGQKTEVTPNADGDDVGTITLTSGLNFKVTAEHYNEVMLYGTNYTRSISIKNNGKQGATAANYQITPEGGGPSISGILGTIAPDTAVTINITVNCSQVTDEKIFKKYNIVINDPIGNKTWNDSVSFCFYRTTISSRLFGLTGGGFVITPERRAYPFSGTASRVRNVTIPRLKGDYIIVVIPLGSSPDNETVYGLDMSVFPDSWTTASFTQEAANFTDTGNFEPNNTEVDAKLIPFSIISYLHRGDIDYYKVTVTVC
jgi:hypothetical protein